MAKYSGSGWHKQSIRHSRARRLGRAGGTYSKAEVQQENYQVHLYKLPNGNLQFLYPHEAKQKKATKIKEGTYPHSWAKGITEKPKRTAGWYDIGHKKHYGKPETLHYIPAPALQSANNLPVQVSLIIPSTKNVEGKTIKLNTKEFNKRIDETKKFFDENFGGDTAIKEVGSYWDGSKNELVKEKGAIVESSMSIPTYYEKVGKITEYAEKKQKDYLQDTMLVTVEGRKFITPKKDYIDHDTLTENEDILVS